VLIGSRGVSSIVNSARTFPAVFFRRAMSETQTPNGRGLRSFNLLRGATERTIAASLIAGGRDIAVRPPTPSSRIIGAPLFPKFGGFAGRGNR